MMKIERNPSCIVLIFTQSKTLANIFFLAVNRLVGILRKISDILLQTVRFNVSYLACSQLPDQRLTIYNARKGNTFFNM